MDVATKESSNSQRPALFGSSRMTLVILCFNCAVIMMVLRFNFSMAIVCMTDDAKSNSTLVISIGQKKLCEKCVMRKLCDKR